MGYLLHSFSHQLFRRVAQEFAERRVDLHELSLGVHRGHARGGIFKNRAEPLFAGLQAFLGSAQNLQVRHVLDHDDALVRLPGEGLDGHGGHVEVADFPGSLQAHFVVGDGTGDERPGSRALFADLVLSAEDFVAGSPHQGHGVGAPGKAPGKHRVGPGHRERGIQDQETSVGMMDHGRELLALPLQDPDLLVQ